MQQSTDTPQLPRSDSKYRLEIQRERRRRWIFNHAGLLALCTAVILFILHAWRQSHYIPERTVPRKGESVIGRYEREIAMLKEELSKTRSKETGKVLPYSHLLGAAVPPPDTVTTDDDSFDKIVIFDRAVPLTSMSCTGRNTSERVCRIKNICFDPARNTFFVLKAGGSIFENGRVDNDTRLVDGTSIDGHNRFFIDYVEAHPSILLGRPVHWVDKLTYIAARFHRFNIMHSLHDDFMGLFHGAKLYGPANPDDPAAPFSLDTHVFFSDWYGAEHYDYLFRLISAHPLQYRSMWQRQGRDPLCFGEAIVGNSKASTWYNYGFLEPQGPIAGKEVSGLIVREAARYILKRLGVAPWNNELVRGVYRQMHANLAARLSEGRQRDDFLEPWDDKHYITIFERTRDRLIQNISDVAEALSRAYGLPVRRVRMEDQTLTAQIVILRSTMVAVGLHGSALILGMFLPPGAVMVELFPLNVPPENYTPYKTMARLPGMQLVYKTWSNKHKANNVPHPERPPEVGGLKHLPEDEQQRIRDLDTVPPHLCCKNPIWLYKIYQDTTVHIPELLRIIDEGVVEASGIMENSPEPQLLPSSPDWLECEVRFRHPIGLPTSPDDNPLDMVVRWGRPWNGVSPDRFGLWVHQYFKEFTATDNEIVLEGCPAGTELDMWVRGWRGDRAGLYGEKWRCACQIGARAVKGSPAIQSTSDL